MNVFLVPPAMFDEVWPEIAPMAERALKRGEGDTITAAYLREQVITGGMQMWAVTEAERIVAVIVLNIVQHPGKRSLFVVMVAGRDFEAWADAVEQLLIEYRSITGCASIETSCRPGMAKKLARRGWRQKAIIMQAPERN